MNDFVVIPGAVVEPIDTKYLTNLLLFALNRCNVHVAGNHTNPWGYFNAPGRPSSLGWVDKTGLLHQYISLGKRGEADFEGNDATDSLETQNNGAEPLTSAQIETIARFYAMRRATAGVANQLAVSSKLGQESKGLSWHRLGVDGNFPSLPSPYAGRLQRGGGMRYSTSFGKVCPGNLVIDQMQQIFDLSQTIDFDLPGVQPPVVIQPQPSAPPVIIPKYRILKEDGLWGTNTTLRLQNFFNTAEDGIISHQWKQKANENIYSMEFDRTLIGSDLAYAMQGALGFTGKKRDRLFGTNSVYALQEHFGTPRDGYISGLPTGSSVVRAMQHALNLNKF